MKNKLIVQETLISIRQHEKEDFISLTDIARAKNSDEPKDVVKNWLRNKNTIDTNINESNNLENKNIN